jgi:peptide/nickel transport system permease protein
MMAFSRKRTVEAEAQRDGGENAIANKEVEGLSQRQIVLRRFVRHRAAMISLFVLLSVIVFVFTASEFHIGPLGWNGWWHYNIKDTPDLLLCKNGNVGCPTLTITPGKGWGLGKHPFGQDDIGHDYFALVMRGAQRSLLVTFIIGIIAGTIGTVVGSIAGFYRGTAG